MRPPKAYKTYEASIDAERDRIRKWRKTRQGAFESDFVSFDEITENYYPLADIMREESIDEDSELEKRRRAYMTAYIRVYRNAPHCLDVLNLIIKNGKERQKSICELANMPQEDV